MFLVYGAFNRESWDRYFYNESTYGVPASEKEAKEVQRNLWQQYDMQTVEGRKDFEEEIRRFQRLYPGMISVEGQEFDFQRFYAKHAMEHGQELSSFDPKLIESLERQKKIQHSLIADKKQESEKKKKSVLGTLLPEFMRPKEGKAYF